jgi:hypothetical protein
MQRNVCSARNLELLADHSDADKLGKFLYALLDRSPVQVLTLKRYQRCSSFLCYRVAGDELCPIYLLCTY